MDRSQGKALNSCDIYDSPPNKRLMNDKCLDSCNLLLDIGAGTGHNISLVKAKNKHVRCVALSCSEQEAFELKKVSEKVITADLEQLNSGEDLVKIGLGSSEFDVVIMSHVLEHLRKPESLVSLVSSVVKQDGRILIAVPNICHWRMRARLFFGRFSYETSGTLDRSHLRFYSFWTALELLDNCRTLKVERHYAVGGAILGPLRMIIPVRVQQSIDLWSTNWFPNLFGYETHLVVVKSRLDE